MVSLSHYKEFGDLKAPSLKEYFSAEPYSGKNEVLRYLKNGKVVVATTSCGVDCVTGKQTNERKDILTDGEFTWSNMLIYYVKEYNMKLPKAFTQKVFSFSEVKHG